MFILKAYQELTLEIGEERWRAMLEVRLEIGAVRQVENTLEVYSGTIPRHFRYHFKSSPHEISLIRAVPLLVACARPTS